MWLTNSHIKEKRVLVQKYTNGDNDEVKNLLAVIGFRAKRKSISFARCLFVVYTYIKLMASYFIASFLITFIYC